MLNLVALLLDQTLKNGGKEENLRRFGASLGQLTEVIALEQDGLEKIPLT